MKINIEELKEVKPKLGGVRSPILSFGKAGYFRLNRYFIQENNLEKKRFVNIRVIKKENKIIVAFNFPNEKTESSFRMSYYESKNKKIKSLTFSGRGVFSEFGLNHRDIVKNKSLKFQPEIQDHDGKKYFIIEISLKN